MPGESLKPQAALRINSGVDMSSPSLTIHTRPFACGWLMQVSMKSPRFSTPTRLLRLTMDPNGSDQPSSANLSSRRKFARTPGP